MYSDVFGQIQIYAGFKVKLELSFQSVKQLY